MCTESVLKTVLSVTYKRLQKIFWSQLEDILLYGSYARGDYDSESDIDIMELVNMKSLTFQVKLTLNIMFLFL